MINWITIAMIALAMTIGSSAMAGDLGQEEAEISPADWEDAMEYGELVDLSKDENGVEWATYWDDAQELMWSQPVDAADENVLDALLSGGSGGLDFEICVVFWPVPYTLTIYDDASNYDTLYYSSGDFAYVDGTSTRRTWNGQASGCFSDIEGYIWSYVRNTTSYCANYDAEYFDRDSGDVWNTNADDDDCYTESGYTYYEVYETGDIAGESEWDYCDYNYTKVARHQFYACDAWRSVVIRYQRVPE